MNNRNAIRIAIVGVGNCASSLIQGIHYYTRERCRQGVTGLMHTQIGDYLPCDIEVVAAFDVAIDHAACCSTLFLAENIGVDFAEVRMLSVKGRRDGQQQARECQSAQWPCQCAELCGFHIRLLTFPFR